ncbi:HK97-gp10 family putative phage morphogenesis protein [Sphingomonas hankookensis]|uniref:HK97-gp10 family putative phage morphogenesis protein n=1 Tax=Sphingomonas hankookensis TaxID=563996 RepID=UPI00234F0D9D|nr:HK97-gp10 family putative phage morphogenesis protein [Sphingomonas hankookensis]WCP71556.1 HK97 gp10 family phage protein [Sphingomonas hankookensis]
MRLSISAKGFPELERKLARIFKAFTADTVQAALTAGAEEIAQEARRLAPVATGALRDSIQVMSSREDMQSYVKSRAGERIVYIGSVGSDPDGDVYYARYIEYGTARTAAHPFLRPALAAKGDVAGQVTVRHFQKAFLEAAK